MKGVVPIYEPGETWSNEELENNFLIQKPVKKVQLYGLLAKRSVGNRHFEDYLREEAESEDNLRTKFFGFIKIAWVPVLAVLEHGDDTLKSELKYWIGNWPTLERELLLDYLAKDKEVLAWLNPTK